LIIQKEQMGILNVEFKERVEGLDEVTCKGISSDPLNESNFLIVFSENEIWEVPLTNIKHISPCK